MKLLWKNRGWKYAKQLCHNLLNILKSPPRHSAGTLLLLVFEVKFALCYARTPEEGTSARHAHACPNPTTASRPLKRNSTSPRQTNTSENIKWILHVAVFISPNSQGRIKQFTAPQSTPAHPHPPALSHTVIGFFLQPVNHFLHSQFILDAHEL